MPTESDKCNLKIEREQTENLFLASCQKNPNTTVLHSRVLFWVGPGYKHRQTEQYQFQKKLRESELHLIEKNCEKKNAS